MTSSNEDRGYCQEYKCKDMDLCREYKRIRTPAELRFLKQFESEIGRRGNASGWGESDKNQKCENRYIKMCPNYVPPISIRGFEGALEDAPGEKIRSQCVMGFLFVFSGIMIPIIWIGFIIGYPHYAGYLILAWAVIAALAYRFSLYNRRENGRLIAVANEEAIYINARKIRWEDIEKITYVFEVPFISSYDLAFGRPLPVPYIEIQCKGKQDYVIYHASIYFLNVIRRHAPSVEVCTKSIRKEALILSGMTLILMIIFSLIT